MRRNSERGAAIAYLSRVCKTWKPGMDAHKMLDRVAPRTGNGFNGMAGAYRALLVCDMNPHDALRLLRGAL